MGLPKEALLAEVLALGGSKEDLELIQGVDSDAEGAKPANKPKDNFDAQEFKSFFKTLGFDQLQRQDEPSDDGEASRTSSGSEENSESSDEEIVSKPVEAPEQSDHPETTHNTASNAEWLIIPQPLWHAIELPTLPEPPASFQCNADLASKLEAQGYELLTALAKQYAATFDNTTFEKSSKNSMGMSKADKAFFSSILKAGTSSDKVSALTLIVTSSPIHCTTYMTQLLSICTKKSRDQSLNALRSVVDWLNGQGLPSNRKLRWFDDQPLLRHVAYARSKVKGKGKDEERVVGDEHLAVFAFEAWLKKWYLDLLKLLESLSHDTVPFTRTQTLKMLHTLLVSKPEQEQNLLRLIVNKLGDTHGPTASATSHQLLQVLQSHPKMGPVVIREVAALVLRPAIKTNAKQEHARYYSLITLNQIVLSQNQPEVAVKLLDLYFEVFQDILVRLDAKPEVAKDQNRGKKRKSRDEEAHAKEHKQEEESKLLAAVLTGAHRALPFAKDSLPEIATPERLDALYKLTHIGTFNTSIQALQLLFQLTQSDQGLPDRFYRTLYDCLIDERLASSTKYSMYLNLLFKSLKLDRNLPRILAFVKRLLQVMLYQGAPFVVGALHLLGQLWTTTDGLKNHASTSGQPVAEKAEGDADAPGEKRPIEYDGRKRDPRFAGAELTALWEFQPLLHHFHPVAADMANKMLNNEPETDDAPELDRYTQAHFLDQFTYRDPKQAPALRGSSAMQPAAGGKNKTGRVIMQRGLANARDVAINSEAFWRQDVSKVPLELVGESQMRGRVEVMRCFQRFFHKFWSSKHTAKQGKAQKVQNRRKTRAESDDEISIADLGEGSDLSDAEEDEIWQAMKATMPTKDDSEEEDASEEGDVSNDDGSASGGESHSAKGAAVEDEDDEEDLPAFEDEDADDMFGSDEEIELGALDVEPDAAEEPSKKKRKIRNRDLPTFASADDYAAYLT